MQQWSIERLTGYARNARVHSKEQVEQLRGSLRKFGWTMPILARADGTVIAGHGRLAAAQAEGMKEVPVIVATGWTKAQCDEYRIVDNKLALNSKWDEELLAKELESLGVAGAELGFTDKELIRLGILDEPPPQEPDLKAQYLVMIECENEKDQLATIERLMKDGIKCRAMLS